MASHRYWRLVGIAVSGHSCLELSEAQMHSAGARADSGATISCTFAPSAGVLAYLQDGLATGVVSWPVSVSSSAGFALVWDFGVGGGADVDALLLGSGSGPDTYPESLTCQWSDDGMDWKMLESAVGIVYPGAFMLQSAAGGVSYRSSVLVDAPIGYWELGEASGSVMLDSSGSGRHGTYGGLAALGADPLVSSGKGISVAATGMATVATVPDDADLKLLSDFALELWVKTSSALPYQWLLTKETGGLREFSWTFLLDAGRPRLALRTSGSGPIAFNLIGPAVNDGARHHLVVDKLDEVITLYLDGLPVAFGVFSGSIWSSPDPVGIGCRYVPGYETGAMVGGLDEVAIYDHSLSPERVQEHYLRGVVSTGSFIQTGVTSPRFSGAQLAVESMQGSERPEGGARSHQREHAFQDVYHGGRGLIRSTVKRKNTPADTPLRRRVDLIDERSRLTIRTMWSDAVTGNYEFLGVREDLVYSVVAWDHLHTYRAEMADNLTLANGGVELLP